MSKKSFSPLRYPGGKSCMADRTVKIIKQNTFDLYHYAEPYAGGCGLALSLLYGGFVSHIHINDIDRGIWSFWHSILNNTKDFISLISNTPVTLEQWYKQRDILLSDCNDPLQIGFATFFLNRTNRSGIIQKAGVIGGFKQNGNYKIDCRFNKDDLIKRIKRIKGYEKRIHLTNLDAIDFLKHSSSNTPEKTLFFIDPPYFNKGSSLYTSFYNPEDHRSLSLEVSKLHKPWIITYDNADEIKQLYKSENIYEFSLNYSLQHKRIGQEIMVTSKDITIPEETKIKKVMYS